MEAVSPVLWEPKTSVWGLKKLGSGAIVVWWGGVRGEKRRGEERSGRGGVRSGMVVRTLYWGFKRVAAWTISLGSGVVAGVYKRMLLSREGAFTYHGRPWSAVHAGV